MVWVYVAQARALGAVTFRECQVEIKDGRVEILLDSPQLYRGIKSRQFNFPQSMVALAWD